MGDLRSARMCAAKAVQTRATDIRCHDTDPVTTAIGPLLPSRLWAPSSGLSGLTFTPLGGGFQTQKPEALAFLVQFGSFSNATNGSESHLIETADRRNQSARIPVVGGKRPRGYYGECCGGRSLSTPH